MSPFMMIHVAAGTIALASGGATLALPKGTKWHRQLGTAFFASMMVMAATGAAVAAWVVERGAMMVGLIVLYLVATSFVTARNRSGTPGRFEKAALAFIIACAAAQFSFALIGMMSADGRFDRLPYQPLLVFAALASFAAVMDVRMLWRGALTATQRIARHLWRMTTAMLIATSSFFRGQDDLFPQSVRESGLLNVPVLLVLGALVYWSIRIRFRRAATPAKAAA